MKTIPDKWKWFNEAKFGLFIHWGPYSQFGRGEQVLLREQLDQREYSEKACLWDPQKFDAGAWAGAAVRAGMRYAVLTSRHHDGYCLWNSGCTDYTSGAQAPKRDFVGEFVHAFRSAGLKVGLYYSLGDWRIPAYFNGPASDPEGWDSFREYCHRQIRELLTEYGKIDVLWFDGAWPRNAVEWKSREIVQMARELQPDILINNRLGREEPGDESLVPDGVHSTGKSQSLGDFGTPEHSITPEPERLWESCQVSTWRLWGWSAGERWRPADQMLDMLVECAERGGK